MKRSTSPKHPDVKGLECKHAFYVEANDGSKDDIVFVKERVHYKDGTTAPNIRVFENYKRDFYITKPNFRNHKDKKEWELESRLQKFSSTQSRLSETIAKLLGKNIKNADIRKLSRSQYLYGTDVSTPTLIKRNYMNHYSDCITPNNVAVLDIETNVLGGAEEIIIISLTYKDRSITVFTEDYIAGVRGDIEQQTRAAINKYIGAWVGPRNTTFEIKSAPTPGDAVKMVMDRAHEWRPDFITIWNIDYDLPRCMKAVENSGYRLEDVFCDPSIPEKYRYCKYNRGKSKKITASNKEMTIPPADQWHWLDCPASFYFIDSMCTYRRLRIAAGMEPSYSLNAILDKHLGVRKLNFAEADGLSELEWHQFMQKHHKILYIVYNIFDCVAVELLDEQIKDLQSSISIQCEHSEYSKMPSQPRRTCDDLHFFVKERGYVIASTSDEMVDELDKYVISMTDWIVTLPAHLTVANGLAVMPEIPGFKTLIRSHVADLDVSSSYPNTEDILNISKETTMRELCKIKGIPEFIQRQVGINITGGHVNAVEICNNVLQFPDMEVVLKQYQLDRAALDKAA